MFKKGQIRKITVKDFVTYSSVEFIAGPNLNMIIGPNGSGKSTIVAAIILGLGGNPKTVGRGTKISEYIRESCSEAEIHIELENGRNNATKISRLITAANKSTWKLNDKVVPTKTVDDVIKQFNIQIDNLCQFLPQDRVQDFAKMNKQELLRNTQIAVCRADLVEKHEQLCTQRIEHKKLETECVKVKQKLQENEETNRQLEGMVQNLEQKQQYIKQIEGLERKVLWLHYDALKQKCDEGKADERTAKELIRQYEVNYAPLETKTKAAKEQILQIESNMKQQKVKLCKIEKSLENHADNCETFKQKMRYVKHEMQTKIAAIQQNRSEINIAQSKIEQLQQDQLLIVNEHGKDANIQQEIAKALAEVKETKNGLHKLEDNRDNVERSKREANNKMQRHQNELLNFENIKQQRLAKVRQIDGDTYKAVLWFRDNKDRFKGNVYEPMILELNVSKATHAKYLENVVAIRDQIAFTCELVEDMNLLMRSLREQGIVANVLHSGAQHKALNLYRPLFPIGDLKRFGMFAYARDLLAGPEAILKYLCKTYNIHNIPIGDSSTNTCFEQLPQEISLFFSDTHRYFVKVSKYSKQRMTTATEIHSNGTLSITINDERVRTIQSSLQEAQASYDVLNDRVLELNREIERVNETRQQQSSRIQKLQTYRLQLTTIEDRIKSYKKRLENLQQENLDENEIRQTAEQNLQDIVTQLVQTLNNISKYVHNYRKLSVEYDLFSISLKPVRDVVVRLEADAHNLLVQIADAKRTLQNVQAELQVLRKKRQKVLEEAKAISNGCTPKDEGFVPFQDEFYRLPDDEEELVGLKDDIQTRIDCIKTADHDELKEYRKRQTLIVELKERIDAVETQFNIISDSMATLLAEWLQPVTDLIGRINAKFGESFARMECTGEVSLYTGANCTDYAEYGLLVKVKYRNNEPMQELNRFVQSGGERAVATAIFMLSLQEITPVPFRCVDEINQGMDPANERKVFQLLMETTHVDGTPQYFLITPKLIPKLKYGPNCVIHFVHNGPFVCSQSKWMETHANVSNRLSLN